MSNHDPELATAEVYLPHEVTAAIMLIEDLPTALGELRCLTGVLVPVLAEKKRTRQFTRVDLVVEAMLAVVARMADDNPIAVTGAIHAGSCACDDEEGVSIKRGLTSAFLRVPGDVDEPGQGMYL